MKNHYFKHQNNKMFFYELSSQMVFSNVVAIQFQAGAITDCTDKQGLAHLIEHLLTHDNKKNNSYLQSELEGVYQFAYTNKESTTYVFTSNSVSITDLLNRAITQITQVISSKSIKEEKSVIKSEISCSKKEISNQIYTRAMDMHVKSIGINYLRYSNDVRGHHKTLSNILEKDVNSFIKKHYANPKIIVTNSKALSLKERELIFKIITKLNWTKKLERSNPKKTINSTLTKSTFNTTQIIALSVIRPQTGYFDVRLGLLLDYISGHWSSILNQCLRVHKQLIYFANSSYHSFKEHALLYIYFDFEKKNLDNINKVISDEMRKLFIDKKINPEILTAVKNIRVNKMRNLFRNEQDWTLDYFDIVKLNHSEDPKNDYTLESYIQETTSVSLNDFQKFITDLNVQIDSQITKNN